MRTLDSETQPCVLTRTRQSAT